MKQLVNMKLVKLFPSHFSRGSLCRSFSPSLTFVRIFFSCFDPQHKADKGELRKQKVLSKEYEDIIQEYKTQVDRAVQE